MVSGQCRNHISNFSSLSSSFACKKCLINTVGHVEDCQCSTDDMFVLLYFMVVSKNIVVSGQANKVFFFFFKKKKSSATTDKLHLFLGKSCFGAYIFSLYLLFFEF
jgi:hypothetical protein